MWNYRANKTGIVYDPLGQATGRPVVKICFDSFKLNNENGYNVRVNTVIIHISHD